MSAELPPASRVLVAGHTGLVGSAILRRLTAERFTAIQIASIQDLDLRENVSTFAWFEANRPEFVFMAAGTVGGILANSTRPAEFLYDNLLMSANVIHASHRTGVQELLYLGSSCIYPRQCPQPIREVYLLAGPLEATNEGYALAKIAGVKLCQTYRRQYGCNFISAMPTNLYGIGDNFDLQSSHVVPALIRKFHEAKVNQEAEVIIWGTGGPRREFLHVDDLADACLFLMRHFEGGDPINVGTGEDLTIGELASLVREIVHPEARLVFDPSKPDGTPQKLLDVSRIHDLGWHHRIPLRDGIESTFRWYLSQGIPQRDGSSQKASASPA